ncbi:Meiosis-specific serine/threonine-protein kinase MEK1 [Hypsizygus marmoreus]|uniref:Meiosis-specific serine/threonine-protein kinase MEK1 n=1 Tax=Hypsizygus marmoreus TaxID=39966 RepID=A0A369K5W1_HYPMA|nr:Meiosis-specific serine/threonine-protein kinase MEK1 [Hypsizygus marmoreus]
MIPPSIRPRKTPPGLRISLDSSLDDLCRPTRGSSTICAKLVTVRQGRKEAVVLSLTKPAIIGRDPDRCSYIVTDTSVSSVHCKLYAVRSPNGGVIVSCQDLSRNGIHLNGQHIRKTCIILMDGDVLELPNSLAFTCVHIWKESRNKITIFDPTPPVQPSHKHIGGYIVTSQCLGTGSFATVHLALDPVKHRQVACKSIRTKKEYEVGQVMKEVRILMTIRHPNINEIYDTEEDKNFIHIFLQLCTGGDLFTYITDHPSTGNRLCEAEAKYVMFQLLKGLNYLHDNMISHRDLKPENILLYSPGPYPRILIADFGLARPNAYQETFNVCGTVSYLPPEGVLALDHKHLGYVGMPADCWSAGVILFIMLSGSHPFDYGCSSDSSSDWFTHIQESRALSEGSQLSQSYVHNESKLKARIIDGRAEFRPYLWKDLKDARLLVESLLVHNHLLRATARSALQNKWIDCELDELESLYDRRILAAVETA